LFWTTDALDDRREIDDCIESDDENAAVELDELFSVNAKRLVAYPNIGRPGRISGTREPVARQNYVLIYDIVEDQVRVLRVLHATKQWPPKTN
jgi:addiction module RelE/StbE family toxin